MLKHEQYEELCTLAIIGEVSPAEMQDLRHHLQGCIACREQYREFTEFLLPQLSFASENEGVQIRDCHESERKRLRSDFLGKAQAKGFAFSTSAVDQREGTELRRPCSQMWHAKIFWQMALGASVASLVFAGGYFTHRELNRNSTVSEATLRSPDRATRNDSRSDGGRASSAPSPEDSKRIAVLNLKLNQTLAELARAQQALQDAETARTTIEGQLEEKNKQIASLESQVQGDAQTSAELRTEAADLKRRIDENQVTMAQNQLRVHDLNEQLSTETASLDREREMLTVGRDVRDLMGARSLHIIDVHDANGAGKNQKSFGRIFYTEGKSLIFYAFDLDDKRVVNANYSYQAWGERLGQPASVKSLGMLYVDDKAERRWSLKVDDPRQLSEINSVFVTLEPRSGEGDKPRGKRILFAFLGGKANHP